MTGLKARPWNKGRRRSYLEPRLLAQAPHARAALQILDQITASIERVNNRRSSDFLALRKGLGYCWSVAVVALPDEGKALMERWLIHADKDVRWIIRENLKKARLVRMDSGWVSDWLARLTGEMRLKPDQLN